MGRREQGGGQLRAGHGERVRALDGVRAELHRRGLFEPDPVFFGLEAAWAASLLAAALALTAGGRALAGGVLLGLFWQQVAGLGHDLGHNSVVRSRARNKLLGSLLAALTGLSTEWWRTDHNSHHVACNDVESDPNIQHLPLLSISEVFLRSPVYSRFHCRWLEAGAAARRAVSVQHWLFCLYMMVARFNLYATGLRFLVAHGGEHRRLELACLALFALWVCLLPALALTPAAAALWFCAAHATSGILHVQIVISHWAMPTTQNSSLGWYETTLATTMNIKTSELFDFTHVGLQFQIEHHLFPRLPRHSLRTARELVRAAAAAHDAPYVEMSFVSANRALFQVLRRVGRATTSCAHA